MDLEESDSVSGKALGNLWAVEKTKVENAIEGRIGFHD